jgi:hypothetical protein
VSIDARVNPRRVIVEHTTSERASRHRSFGSRACQANNKNDGNGIHPLPAEYQLCVEFMELSHYAKV